MSWLCQLNKLLVTIAFRLKLNCWHLRTSSNSFRLFKLVELFAITMRKLVFFLRRFQQSFVKKRFKSWTALSKNTWTYNNSIWHMNWCCRLILKRDVRLLLTWYPTEIAPCQQVLFQKKLIFQPPGARVFRVFAAGQGQMRSQRLALHAIHQEGHPCSNSHSRIWSI